MSYHVMSRNVMSLQFPAVLCGQREHGDGGGAGAGRQEGAQLDGHPRRQTPTRKHCPCKYFPRTPDIFQTRPLTGVTQIGEPLSILIFLSGGAGGRDVKAQDCWAYDRVSFGHEDTNKIQLTGRDGCPM